MKCAVHDSTPVRTHALISMLCVTVPHLQLVVSGCTKDRVSVAQKFLFSDFMTMNHITNIQSDDSNWILISL